MPTKEQSPFVAHIDKYFAPMVLRHAELINQDQEGLYLHKKMLAKRFSLTGRWDNLTSLNSRVAADVVSLDSALPLKSRPSLRKVSGDITKIGMKRRLIESDLVHIHMLLSIGRSETEVAAELLKDVPAVITGIYERLECTFLNGLSSGVASIEDADNVGTGVRIDYGYLKENLFKAKDAVWGASGYTPLSDIQRILDVASNKGHKIKHIYMDKATFNHLASSEEVRSYVAGINGVYVAGANVPRPTLAQLNEAVSADTELGFTIHIIDRTVDVEHDGKRKTLTPWEAGKVIFTTTDKVGSLVWAESAEKLYPVSGKNYQAADEFILVSQWRDNEPLCEQTSSQARVVPVICNVESIYQLDTKKKG